MTELPITMLAYDGPILRAYLVGLARAGFRCRRIVHLLDTRHPATRKPVGRGLPSAIRRRYLAWTQEIACNHWPRRIARSAPELVAAIADGLTAWIDEPQSWLAEMQRPLRDLTQGVAMETVVVNGWRDRRLADALAAHGPGDVLYTGGGIVPKEILTITGLRVLHIHPGLLPEVRGADGLLWSILLHGRCGCSCFWMEPGLDTGPVIYREAFETPRVVAANRHCRDRALLYRALYSCVDPIMRAATLGRCLQTHGPDPAGWPATPQDPQAGATYHFMHADLQRVALDRVFVPAQRLATISADPPRQTARVVEAGC